MNTALPILVGVAFGMVFGFLAGYRYTEFTNKIRTLEGRAGNKPEKPTVIVGAYQPPKQVSSAVDTKRAAGLVETKTPELLAFETDIALEKEALGR